MVGAIGSVGGGHGLGIHREIARRVQEAHSSTMMFPHHVGGGVPVDHPAALERGSTSDMVSLCLVS